MRPVIAERRERERFDRAILRSALDPRRLPPYLPLEPNAVGAAIATAEVALPALDSIREAHGLDAWSPESFERVFLGEAMRAWHGPLDVERREEGALLLTARATRCPAREHAAADARVCQLCRALHVTAAQQAFGYELRGVPFTKLITRGDDACEMNVIAARP